MTNEYVLPTKKIETYLILDYRSNNLRVIKKMNPKKLKPFEIPIKVNLTVIVPKTQEFVLTGDITVKPAKVDAMFIEDL